MIETPAPCFMGKTVPSATHLQDLVRFTSKTLDSPKLLKPRSRTRFLSEQLKCVPASAGQRGNFEQAIRKMEEGSEKQATNRVSLSDVVSDCVKRRFQETLKEARAGDSGMQVLVGQMYYSGYGVPRDVQKGRAWFTKASKSRSSVWKVSDKHPGYNASDSDSDELKGDLK
ncbi:uncharacterized protein LOC131222483 [Magnolia sinica]|uniref:uncharacterized protein LOC131222483 n=1 Tax=Magnolia sinica TaxID=86752 RepID=UPI002658A1CE|nr:uncharacterized protein LOC131222483 [Magnolia sinica]